MFDWEDEEIASIIWGKEGENEDHIVSYPDETYGEQGKVSGQEDADVKLTQKTTVSKNISENNAQYDTHGRVSTDGSGSLLDLSTSEATKLDHEHTDENTQVDSGSQVFDNQAEDRGGCNFVDYGWANVGSFDDLDRIISNHDLELWSSTKDVIGGPERSELLPTNSSSLNFGNLKGNCQHFGTKSGFINDEKQTNVSGGGKNEIPRKEKMKRELEGQHTQNRKYSSFKVARNQESEPSGYTQYISSPRGYNMMINQHSEGSALPNQQVSSYLSDKTRLNMTPEQKIEKLRRRQQMRALLAIRKQQQEIRQQVDYSNLEICSQESQMPFVRGGRVEIDQSASSFVHLDVSSPLEHSDSNARPVVMDKTVLADSVVHQLRNVIAGLGIQMRLCIRDSLFRLAQSALQRKNDGTNKRSSDEPSVFMEGVNSTKRSTRTQDQETRTNPIDRAVAHLLFNTLPVHSASGAKLHCEDNQVSCLDENKPLENTTTADASGLEPDASSLL